MLSLSDNCVPANRCTVWAFITLCAPHTVAVTFFLIIAFRSKTSERNSKAGATRLRHAYCNTVVNWLWLERLFRGRTDVATLPGCGRLLVLTLCAYEHGRGHRGCIINAVQKLQQLLLTCAACSAISFRDNQATKSAFYFIEIQPHCARPVCLSRANLRTIMGVQPFVFFLGWTIKL